MHCQWYVAWRGSQLNRYQSREHGTWTAIVSWNWNRSSLLAVSRQIYHLYWYRWQFVLFDRPGGRNGGRHVNGFWLNTKHDRITPVGGAYLFSLLPVVNIRVLKCSCSLLRRISSKQNRKCEFAIAGLITIVNNIIRNIDFLDSYTNFRTRYSSITV